MACLGLLPTGSRGSGALAQRRRGATGSSYGSPRVFPTSGRKGRKESLVRRVEVRLAGGASPAWPNRSVPHPRSAWAAGLPGQSGLAQSLSGLSPLLHPWPVSSLGILA